MTEPLKRTAIREEEVRPPATAAALRYPPQKNGSADCRSPPPGQRREAPGNNSPLRSPRQEKASFDLYHESPSKGSTFTSPRTAESSLPASPLRPPSPFYDSPAKSPVREGTVTLAHLRSFLDDGRSPNPQPEALPVANRMAAPAAPAEARLGAGVGKGMRVEPGVVRWAPLLRTEVGIRVLEVVLCLVSFSVMAAGKTRGWDGDSFDRYQEYRYCLSMNVLAFAYAMFQVYAHFYHRMKSRHIISRPLSYYFDFCIDQLLAYLLLSASSSAATRNDEWVAMFGSDGFTDRMSGSIAISFLAFFAFASSCIISAYKLFSMGM